MEYLVTMTTRVPDGTSAQDVDDVRAREAAHSRELAAEGRLLRLWRPPLRPGEWRSIGLFDAADADSLEATLASMPLRIWRTDEVTVLDAHPNDPGRGAVPPAPGSTEYLVTFIIDVPSGTGAAEQEDMFAREAARARQLAGHGRLVRLWALAPGRTIGLWQATGAGEMDDILQSLPLADWLTVETVALTPHPNDPAVRTAATA
jgi:muconolactone delta-isomerase